GRLRRGVHSRWHRRAVGQRRPHDQTVGCENGSTDSHVRWALKRSARWECGSSKRSGCLHSWHLERHALIIRAVPPFHLQAAQLDDAGGKILAEARFRAGLVAGSARPAAEVSIGVTCWDAAATIYLEVGLNPAFEHARTGGLLRVCTQVVGCWRGSRRWQ